MRISSGRLLALPLSIAATFFLASPLMAAESRPAAECFPADTLVFVSVPDGQLLRQRAQETSYGRILQDPQVRPLVEQIYQSLAEPLAGLESQLNVKMPELVNLLQGELAFALVPRAQATPAMALMCEIGDDPRTLDKLVAYFESQLADNGSERTEVNVEGVRLVLYQKNEEQVVLFRHGNRQVVTNDALAAKAIIQQLSGGQEPSLADHPPYATVVERAQAGGEPSAQLLAFADPIGLAYAITEGNTGAKFMLGMLSALGLECFEGIGASVSLATPEFDQVTRLHLVMSDPRTGIADMVALGTGNTAPEAWVPDDVAKYRTVHWNVSQSVAALAKVVDSVQGEGAFNRMVGEQVQEVFGVDLQKDLLSAFSGRITMLTWPDKSPGMEIRTEPDGIQGVEVKPQLFLSGIQLKDAEGFEKTLEKMLAKYPDAVQRKQYAGVNYFELRNAPSSPNPTSYATIFDGYLMVTDRIEQLEKVLRTKSSGQPLSDSLDFKLVDSKLRRHLGAVQPGSITFRRSEHSVRAYYNYLNSETTRATWAAWSETSPVFKALQEAFSLHPLPPYEVIARYVAPGGSMLTSDHQGLHYTNFSLRRK